MRPVPEATDDELLRGGIRGATEFEILKIIEKSSEARPVLLESNYGGHHDRIDLWHSRLNPHRWRTAKLALKAVLKTIKAISGHVLVPYLTIAIQKRR
jgi:hypothetical protein